MKGIDMSGVSLFQEDCLNVMKEMPDESIDLIVTDPPYRCISGGKPHLKGQPSGILAKNDGKIFTENNIEPEEWFPELFRVLKNGSHCYIMTNVLNLERYLTLARETGFSLHNVLIWEKNNCTPNRWYMKNCEYVLFLRKGRAKKINNVGSKTVHQFNNIVGNKLHPTEKPVDLLQFYIVNSSNEGDIVFDPFMGSGSTGIAAKNLGRDFIGIELDENYFAIAQERIEKHCDKDLCCHNVKCKSCEQFGWVCDPDKKVHGYFTCRLQNKKCADTYTTAEFIIPQHFAESQIVLYDD